MKERLLNGRSWTLKNLESVIQWFQNPQEWCLMGLRGKVGSSIRAIILVFLVFIWNALLVLFDMKMILAWCRSCRIWGLPCWRLCKGSYLKENSERLRCYNFSWTQAGFLYLNSLRPPISQCLLPKSFMKFINVKLISIHKSYTKSITDISSGLINILTNSGLSCLLSLIYLFLWRC